MTGAEDETGRVLAGRYTLMRRLGIGGMGRVWLAHDEMLACDVALKEIDVPPDLPESEMSARIARARREAQHAARLRNHPHVATVHDIFEEGGLPWIVMEYVPGATDLDALVRERGPLPTAEVARIGLAVLDALMEGHRLGILHRDVKPANVLLTSVAPRASFPVEEGQVLLADYGIALEPASGEPRLTAPIGVLGTLSYMAPERARGEEPSAESDLFSLGATLYFAVMGQGPFDADTDTAALVALLSEEPQLPADITGPLAPVLKGLLAKDPAERMTGQKAAEKLAEVIAPPPSPPPQPTITNVPPSPEPEPKPRRKLPASRIVAIAVAAALVLGGAVWAASALFRDSSKPEPPKPTGPVLPYGDAVGLKQELKPGDCVSAVWGGPKFQGQPKLGLLNCSKDDLDGQVVDVANVNSLDDATRNGNAICDTRLRATVQSLADAQSYALPPSKQGWESGVRAMPCLVFGKVDGIIGPVGAFRHTGDRLFFPNTSVGDCFDTQTQQDNSVHRLLADCNAPHQEQVLGFVDPPANFAYQSADEEFDKLCVQEYGTYQNDIHFTKAWVASESLWNEGFRYVMCTLIMADGSKLPGGTVSSAALSG
ncbi:serine/threonine protein kinase [Streptomyces sp. TLI_235]|nr:serine/threonine-protein kinase [Streptomyces sp. TLI_235]PBC76172.1 serine/threonine protein kinase [Streptomyces sp. TLI_235]